MVAEEPETGDAEAEVLAERLRRTIPDLDALLRDLDSRSGDVIPPAGSVRAPVGTAHLFGEQRPGDLTAAMERERQQLLDFARQAVAALKRGEGVRVPFTLEERRGAAALLTFLTRPALLVRGDDYAEPPPPWREDLNEGRRRLIRRVLPSVGRIVVSGHPTLSWVGTGWVAAPDLLMTNRHVVEAFAAPETEQETRWRLKPGMAARINFGEEWTGAPSADERRTYDVPGDAVIRVHPDHDLALMPVASTARGGAPLPAPLPIAPRGDGIVEGRKIYVVGYPARISPYSRELAAVNRLFDALFDVKRLQPGQVMQVLPDSGTILHDCTTLGGNSGSPVLDLVTHRVVGLHYAGFHRHANTAVALWMLADDALLREAGLRFAGQG